MPQIIIQSDDWKFKIFNRFIGMDWSYTRTIFTIKSTMVGNHVIFSTYIRDHMIFSTYIRDHVIFSTYIRDHVIFSTYIRKEWVRKSITVSLILHEFSCGKEQIPCRFCSKPLCYRHLHKH